MRTNPPDTPTPLQQSTPSTSNSNIYPALNNVADLLLVPVSLIRQLFSDVRVGMFQQVFPRIVNLTNNPEQEGEIRVM